MAAIKREYNRSHPTLTTGGSTTVQTLTPATALTAYSTGFIIAAKLGFDLGAAATLNVSGLSAKKIYLINATSVAVPVGGEAKAGHTLFFYYDATLDGAAGGWVVYAGLPSSVGSEAILICVTSETGLVSTGTGKVTFRMPYALTLTGVRASLATAQSSGNILTIDINESGTTILSTKLTIDNTETTSTTAATPAVISDTALAADAQITIDIDQIGNGTAAGLKVYLVGHQ